MRLSGRKSSSYTQRWTQRQRFILLTLISANVAVFVAQLCVELYEPGFVHGYLGLSDRGVRDAYAWQFVTAMFLHNGPWHLLGNMVVLYFLGRDLEWILGQRHFLYLYLAGAVAGELGHLFLMPSDSRSEEHTSELQSPDQLVCRLLLEKKKNQTNGTLQNPSAMRPIIVPLATDIGVRHCSLDDPFRTRCDGAWTSCKTTHPVRSSSWAL